MIEGWDLLLSLLPGYAIRIGAALVCGVMLGIERERKGKPAGLRTIVLITVGATIYMIVSDLIPLVTEGPESITRVDPSRIASQVVTGIGFLGAGTIIQSRGAVHGLTTAAVIWVAAGIGLCVGAGFPLIALGVTLAVLGVLIALDPLSHWLSRRGRKQHLTIFVPDDRLTYLRLTNILEQHGVMEDDLRVIAGPSDRREDLRVEFAYTDHGSATQRMLDALARIEGVHSEKVEGGGAKFE